VSEAEIVVVADPESGAAEAAGRVATILSEAAAARGRADWATTGGTTPIGTYGRLVAPPYRDGVPWADVHVWFGDDRYVPRDHPYSNVKPLDDIMLGIEGAEEGTAGGPHAGVQIPAENVHPFPTSEAIGHARGPEWCAATLADELREAPLERVDGWPAFDLMLLGIGADAHILSVFPGSTAFDSPELALAIPAPTHIAPRVQRVTLNPAVVGAARHVLVVAFGSDKAAAIGSIHGPEYDARRWPAQIACRPGATWILDAAAATALPR
jgi:6-phosphogluconolactonase